MEVKYNASNNELVRTKTLVKGAVIQVDAVPFRQYYQQQYGIVLGQKKADKKEEKVSEGQTKKQEARRKTQMNKMDQSVADQFRQGRLFARISSRPGQCGRCDGYILEGPELQFYLKKMQKKKGK